MTGSFLTRLQCSLVRISLPTYPTFRTTDIWQDVHLLESEMGLPFGFNNLRSRFHTLRSGAQLTSLYHRPGYCWARRRWCLLRCHDHCISNSRD